MGSKFRLGKIPKNYELKQQAMKKRSRGQPKRPTPCMSLPPAVSDQAQQEDPLTTLHAAIVLNPQWVDRSSLPDKIIVCKLSDANDLPSVTHSIMVNGDLSWKITVHGQCVPSNCSLLSHVPSKLTVKSFKSLLSIVDTCSVCPGHPDPHFINLLEAKKGKLLSKDGSEVAIIDKHGVILNGETYV